jgi:uncharacterized protein (DUF2235 family)
VPKNIVFCADGTWNGPGEPDTDPKDLQWTNVFKTYLNLAGTDSPESTRFANEQEREYIVDGKTLQIAKYLHGVGDSDNFLVKALGGGFGEGLIARIVRGYTFVSRNYQPGDKIYLIGFSRGAYTARSLAGLISAKGLLPPNVATEDEKEDAYRKGSAVWYEWRQESLEKANKPLVHLQEWAQDLPHFLFDRSASVGLVQAPIEAVAVWDTVGAYGIPEFDAHQEAVDSFAFADLKLSDNVKFGLHAISIDEQRGNFTPTLWADRDGIVQVLFPGAHADVGGGYKATESGLSDGAFVWMTGKLKKLGVLYAATPTVTVAPDAFIKSHEPWTELPWSRLRFAPRVFAAPPTLGLAQTVLDRIASGALNPAYLPANVQYLLAGKVAAAGIVVVPLDDRDD